MTEEIFDALTHHKVAAPLIPFCVRDILGVFDWSSSVTYVLTDWTFITILSSTGSGNEAM